MIESTTNSTKTPRRTRRLLSMAVCALASATLWTVLGCNTHAASSNATQTDPASGASFSDQPQLFKVPEREMSHIQLVTLEPSTISRNLTLTGTVAFNGFATTPVISQISGPVSRIVVMPGAYVHRGEPLLYVTSPDYSQLLASYLKARDAQQLAQKNYERAQDLYQHHAIAQADLETAASTQAQSAADVGAAEQALRAVGITDPNSLVGRPAVSEVPVRAPISGEAVERLVAPGQVIQAGATQIFTISNMSSVWVLANIYQNDLPYVKVGDAVTITTDAYPGTAFHGKISYISAALDPNTRTLQARIEVKNPGEKLKKDMYVNATVSAGTLTGALSVPSSAVLRDSENQPFVYVAGADNSFGRRSVTIGDTSNGKVQLLSGVKAGERVVGDGSLFLQFANSLQQ